MEAPDDLSRRRRRPPGAGTSDALPYWLPMPPRRSRAWGFQDFVQIVTHMEPHGVVTDPKRPIWRIHVTLIVRKLRGIGRVATRNAREREWEAQAEEEASAASRGPEAAGKTD